MQSPNGLAATSGSKFCVSSAWCEWASNTCMPKRVWWQSLLPAPQRNESNVLRAGTTNLSRLLQMMHVRVKETGAKLATAKRVLAGRSFVARATWRSSMAGKAIEICKMLSLTHHFAEHQTPGGKHVELGLCTLGPAFSTPSVAR